MSPPSFMSRVAIDLTGDSDTEPTTLRRDKKRHLNEQLSSGNRYAEARFQRDPDWDHRQDGSPSARRATISKLVNNPETVSPTQFSSSKTSLSSLTAFSLDGAGPDMLSPAGKGSIHSTPNSRHVHGSQKTPKQTPNKNEWTSEKLESALRELSKELLRDHTKLVDYTLRTASKQVEPTRRHLSSTADLADLTLEPLDPKIVKKDIMKVKMKVRCSLDFTYKYSTSILIFSGKSLTFSEAAWKRASSWKAGTEEFLIPSHPHQIRQGEGSEV